MFDSASGSVLDASVVSGVVAALSAALSGARAGSAGASAGLDDAGRVDAIRAFEELVCVATAAQAELAADLDSSQRAEQATLGVPGRRQGRGVAAQVALARRESHHRGQRHLGLAKVVRSELPQTWKAWCLGRIGEWKATLVARETVFLSREDRLAVDEAVCGDLDAVERMGDRELAQACQKVAYRLDPAGYVERRRRAEADRSVTIRPAPDGMVWLTALLPVKDGVAVHAVLSREADSARALGDPRSRGQAMADGLVDAVLTAAARQREAQTSWHQPTTAEPDRPAGPGVTINLVMSDATLFGSSEESAYVEGYGTIPAELGREIVRGACDDGDEVWLRRLYASPTTGELMSMDSVARQFRNNLARFIRLRDQTCRTPWCDAPIRHTDHAEGHDAGGPTSAANGQGLCEACNHAKQAPGWTARGAPGWREHWIRTRTPTGHVYETVPPTVVEQRLRAVVDFGWAA